MKIPDGVLIAVCRELHRFAQTVRQPGRKKKFVKVEWDSQNAPLVHYYVKKAEPILNALMAAGYVPLPASQVAQAYRPLVEMNPVHPVIRLSQVGEK